MRRVVRNRETSLRTEASKMEEDAKNIGKACLLGINSSDTARDYWYQTMRNRASATMFQTMRKRASATRFQTTRKRASASWFELHRGHLQLGSKLWGKGHLQLDLKKYEHLNKLTNSVTTSPHRGVWSRAEQACETRYKNILSIAILTNCYHASWFGDTSTATFCRQSLHHSITL